MLQRPSSFSVVLWLFQTPCTSTGASGWAFLFLKIKKRPVGLGEGWH